MQTLPQAEAPDALPEEWQSTVPAVLPRQDQGEQGQGEVVMSDRRVVLTISGEPYSDQIDRTLTVFMDGDTGTWRIFVEPMDSHYCIDLTYSQLVELRDGLSEVIADIAKKPNDFDARVRSKWQELEDGAE